MMARDDARFELLATSSRATLLFENIALGNKREIYLSRTQHPSEGDPTYLGDSIARFDGDTLVVDTVGFNDMTWLNDAGAPHSGALHLVERIRPVQGGRVPRVPRHGGRSRDARKAVYLYAVLPANERGAERRLL